MPYIAQTPALSTSKQKTWLSSQSCHFVNNQNFNVKLLHDNVQCVYIVEALYQIVPAKALVGVDRPMTALSIPKHNPYI